MARPHYICQKEKEVKVVSSQDMMELVKSGWVNVRKATPEEVSSVSVVSVPVIEHSKVEEIEKKTYSPQFNKPEEIESPQPDIEIKSENDKDNLTDKDIVSGNKSKKVSQHNKTNKRNTKNTKSNKNTKNTKDNVCPHCGVKSRSKESYEKNHGDNCIRLIK